MNVPSLLLSATLVTWALSGLAPPARATETHPGWEDGADFSAEALAHNRRAFAKPAALRKEGEPVILRRFAGISGHPFCEQYPFLVEPEELSGLWG